MEQKPLYATIVDSTGGEAGDGLVNRERQERTKKREVTQKSADTSGTRPFRFNCSPGRFLDAKSVHEGEMARGSK